MTNSLAIFQIIINNIFWDLIIENIIIMYLDNILIFIWTLAEYHRIVCKVLEVLTKHKQFLYLKKCKFKKTYIEYLSLVISKNQVEIDLIKIARAHN